MSEVRDHQAGILQASADLDIQSNTFVHWEDVSKVSGPGLDQLIKVTEPVVLYFQKCFPSSHLLGRVPFDATPHAWTHRLHQCLPFEQAVYSTFNIIPCNMANGHRPHLHDN